MLRKDLIKDRAGYGEFLIKSISETLQPQFRSEFSIRQLEMSRQFCRSFPNTTALRSQFSWTHYKTLLVEEMKKEMEQFDEKKDRGGLSA